MKVSKEGIFWCIVCVACLIAMCIIGDGAGFAQGNGWKGKEQKEQEATTPVRATPVTVVYPDPAPAPEEQPAAEPAPEPAAQPAAEPAITREDIPLSPELQIALQGAAKEFSVDYYVMVSIIERETNFQNLIGDDGRSTGYCQIQRRWWGDLMQEIGAADLTDPVDNFRTGSAILRYLTDLYEGDITDALTAYNTGHGGDSAYARGILEAADRWRA